MMQDTMIWVTVAAMPVDRQPNCHQQRGHLFAKSHSHAAGLQEQFDAFDLNIAEDEWLDLWDRKDTVLDAMLQST